ncbi:MAG: GNAT family N-acetyltransferase [Planctomycetes bacterium]|nr:GNAT family N-acetyltransferase [Planctomycetota bacterium]
MTTPRDGIVDFAPLRLVPYERAREPEVVALLAACYAEYGQVVELDTLDADLLRIPEVYHGPEHGFWTLLDGKRLVGTVAVKGPHEVADAEAGVGTEAEAPAVNEPGTGRKDGGAGGRTAPPSHREAELKRVFLYASHRGRGLGKRLVLWAFEWARDRGYGPMHIWSDVTFLTAHQLYRRLGAEESGGRRYLGGRNKCEELHFLMRLSGAPLP